MKFNNEIQNIIFEIQNYNNYLFQYEHSVVEQLL